MPKDHYLPMLLSSLLALMVTVLGWSAFGKVQTKDKVDVTELISTNYIPSVFLVSFTLFDIICIVVQFSSFSNAVFLRFFFLIKATGGFGGQK